MVTPTVVVVTPSRRRRWWRWLARALLALGLAAGLALAALAALLHHLDQPWVKRRVQALVRRSAGVDIDYRAARAALFSGLAVDDLVVRAPPALRAMTPALARAGRLEVGWTRASLLGRGPRLLRVAVRDLDVTLVVDERGRTSIDLVSPPAPGAPPTPPSRLAAELLASTPAVAHVEVERAALTLLRSRAGRPVERWRAGGLGLRADFARGGDGWQLQAALGSPAAPLAVALSRDGAAGGGGSAAGGLLPAGDLLPAGSAALRLWLTVHLARAAAELALDARVVRQSFAPGTTVDHLVHLEGSARFARGHTELTLGRVDAADGAADLSGTLDLPDDAGAAPLVTAARGEVDLPRLLAVVPPDLAPLTVARGRLHWQVDRLAAAALPRLAPGGRATVEGDVAGLTVPLAGGALTVAGGRISLRAQPDGDAVATRGILALRGVRRGGGAGLAADGLDLALDGALRDGAWSGTATLALASLDRRAAAARLALRGAQLALHARALRLDPAAPLASRGGLELTGHAATLDLVRAGVTVAAAELGAAVRADLRGGAPYAVDATLPVGRLRLDAAGGRRLVDGPARLALRLGDLFPDARAPRRTRGAAHLTAALGGLHAALDAVKQPDAIDFTVAADAPSLAAVRLLVPAHGRQIPWARMALALRSTGRLARLASAAPELRHRTELRLDRPGFRARDTALDAASLAIVAESHGTRARHRGDIDVRVRGLSVGATAAGAGHVTLAVALDAPARTVTLRATSDGDAGPDTTVRATIGFDRARRALTWDLDGRLSRLGLVGPMLGSVRALRGFDFDALALSLTTRGALLGVIRDVGRDGRVRLAPQPLATAAAEASSRLSLSHLRYRHADRALDVPAAEWNATLHTSGTRRTVESDVAVAEAHLAVGRHQLDVADVRDDVHASIDGNLADGVAALTQHLSVRSLRQDLVPAYPTGALDLALQARRDDDGTIRVTQLTLTNAAAGSALTLRGGLDVGDQRRRLSLRGQLDQDLGRLWRGRETFVGAGRLALAFRVHSSDLRVFRTAAALHVTGARIELPRAHVLVDNADGEVPVALDFALGRRGLRLLRDATANPYSELRFADQHPLLSRRSFLSVARIITPLATVAPLAGNLRIDHNIVALSQLEMGIRGGRVTGQCVLDWRRKDSTIQAHVRATGVQSSHGEPFDGNAAVTLSTRERSIDGRAEILRIGRRHLLDLLQLQDPHHTDAAINRVRRALALGYPDHVRLAFKHGFASVRVTFGGLARLMRVDELRGIPMGPLIDRVLAPLSSSEEEP